ncbi:MAG: flagellar biosynthetic protein FliR [Proteobacteria bacterium]|nr:flagellar biosynthetic protein FliR [Pseudomonadota bacterium]MBU1685958.1 flagellar biosynthetic protein FliR [Pseudomonadota bacterium]
MIDAGILNWTLNQALHLLIILTRVGPLIFLMPVTGSQGVPVQIKIMISLTTALILVPVVSINPESIPQTSLGFVILAGQEIFLAATLSIFARFVFAAVETAGQMIGVQMGMGMAGTMDPQFGTQTSLVGFFWNLVAILLFLSIDGHHLFFRTLAESYQWIQPGGLHISQATYEGLMRGMAQMFVLAVKIMAPAGAALFFSHVAMGIIAKTVPQIPILIVGLPINLGVGLLFMGLSLGYLTPLLIENFNTLGRLLPRLAMGMGG